MTGGQAGLHSDSRVLRLHCETLFLKKQTKRNKSPVLFSGVVYPLAWMLLKHPVLSIKKTTISTHFQDQQCFPGNVFHFLSLFELKEGIVTVTP